MTSTLTGAGASTTLDARGERGGEEDEAEKGDGQALHKPPPDGRNATPGGPAGQRHGQLRLAPSTRSTSPSRACATEFRASSPTIASTSSSSSVGRSASVS
jgi:hypothetical protein